MVRVDSVRHFRCQEQEEQHTQPMT